MTTMATRLPTKFKTVTESLRASVQGVRPSKYRNVPVEIDGRRFASKAEGKRYRELTLLTRAGEIGAVVCQPRFPMMVQGKLITTYVADFSYCDEAGELHVEDVKGMLTPEFKLKRKLFEAIYAPQKIELIKA